MRYSFVDINFDFFFFLKKCCLQICFILRSLPPLKFCSGGKGLLGLTHCPGPGGGLTSMSTYCMQGAWQKFPVSAPRAVGVLQVSRVKPRKVALGCVWRVISSSRFCQGCAPPPIPLLWRCGWTLTDSRKPDPLECGVTRCHAGGNEASC